MAKEDARAYGRSLRDLEIEGQSTPNKLLPAEEKLLVAASKGEFCRAGGSRPTGETEDNKIRGSFVRFLALGGDAQNAVHEKGVKLTGAYIEGDLDLEGCGDVRQLLLGNCWIAGAFILREARTQRILLDGSRVAGLQGNGVRTAGDVHLRHGFESEGEVQLMGAEIRGDLDCAGGLFRNIGGTALALHRARVSRDVFLSTSEFDASMKFVAEGAVRLRSTIIGGSLACIGGSFSNTRPRRKSSEDDEGQTKSICDEALEVYRTKISGTLWLGPSSAPHDYPVKIEGSLDLRESHAAALVDHKDSWPVAKVTGPEDKELTCAIHLDGFTYGRFAGNSSLKVAEREAWLVRQPPSHLGKDFRPHPFEQLIKVYREMGHAKRARDIAIFKEKMRLRRPWHGKPWWCSPANLVWWLVGEKVAGYGYRWKGWVILVSLVWLLAWGFYDQAGRHGAMAPADPIVFLDPQLEECRENWTSCTHPKMVDEHTPFQPVVYALDVLLPIVSLGQETAWAPMVKAFSIELPGPAAIPVHKWAGFVLMWTEILLGWVFGIVLAGLGAVAVKRD